MSDRLPLREYLDRSGTENESEVARGTVCGVSSAFWIQRRRIFHSSCRHKLGGSQSHSRFATVVDPPSVKTLWRRSNCRRAFFRPCRSMALHWNGDRFGVDGKHTTRRRSGESGAPNKVITPFGFAPLSEFSFIFVPLVQKSLIISPSNV